MLPPGNSPLDQAAAQTPLRVSLIPNIAPEEQKAKVPDPSCTSKRRSTDLSSCSAVATNYAGVVQAMASDKLDLAYEQAHAEALKP